MKTPFLATAAALALGMFTAAAPAQVPADSVLPVFQPPLPAEVQSKDNPLTPEKINLGRMLYYDARLSKSQQISCNSCHQLDKFGVDGSSFSVGHKKQHGGRNAPTVYNAAGHIAQFWDGRAKDVEEQAKGPVLNPVEMAMPNPEYVLRVLNSIPGYVEAFHHAFPGEKDPVNYDNFGKAVGAFERKLMTPGRWDKYLAGDKNALTAEEKQGFQEFVNNRCFQCHMGTYVGGTTFQKLGLFKPWPNQKDQGRYEVTHNDADRMIFKVPSLRNIAKTGPYFHDGSVHKLPDAVRMMGRHQVGVELSDSQVDAIVTFLNALTGEPDAAYIKAPKLPPSGPNTPKPDLN